jgi:Flp pilus assembly protein TadG
LLPVLFGCVAFAIDIGFWYATQRSLQNAADAAVIAAALNDSSTYQSEAQANSAQYGFVDGVSGITVTASNNQTCPDGQTTCYRVTISKTAAPQFFSQLLGFATPTLIGTALATGGQSDTCVLALSPSGTGVRMNGNANVDLHCGLGIDSSGSQALLMNGNNSLTATSCQIVGQGHENGPNTISIPNMPCYGEQSIPDPYANVQIPSYSGCTYPSGQTINGNGSFTLDPGIYCGSIIINGNPTVTLNPGTYILSQGSFIINGSPTVTGNGVAIVLTSGNFTDNGTPVLNLTAESANFSGAYPMPGFVIFNRGSGSATINGASGTVLDGALYFPNANVTYNGTPTTGPGCTQIVASTITFNGTPTLYDNTCQSQFGLGMVGNFPELVE